MSKGQISPRRRRNLRGKLVKRDGARCFYCQTRFRNLDDSTIDHIVPRTHGGTWVLTNLVLACKPCNVAKGHRPIVEFIRPKGYMPGLRPRTVERTRQAVTGTARVGRAAALVPLIAAGWVLTLH